MSDIANKLLQYIKAELAPKDAKLELESNLVDVIDSTAVMEIVVWIEGEYGFDVEIDDITPDNFGSAAKLAAYIEKHKG
jgi:acyl carrier protein